MWTCELNVTVPSGDDNIADNKSSLMSLYIVNIDTYLYNGGLSASYVCTVDKYDISINEFRTLSDKPAAYASAIVKPYRSETFLNDMFFLIVDIYSYDAYESNSAV